MARQGGTYLRPSSARSGAVPRQLEAPREVRRPPAAPAAPGAGRLPRSTTPRDSSLCPRCARNSKCRCPPTVVPAGRGSRAPGSPWSRRRGPSGRCGSGTRGRRPPARSWRANSKPPTGGMPQDLSRADQHPRHPARAGEGARAGPPAQGLRHPARTPHRPAHRHLRPQRHRRHVLRPARRRRADRAPLHPGEDPRRPGHRRRQGQPRRTAEGRRRLTHLRPRTEGQGRPVPDIAKKLTI